MEELANPIDKAEAQLTNVQSDGGARMSRLEDQTGRLTLMTNTRKNVLSATEEADMNKTIMQLQKTNVTLQALREASSRVISQSLFDFLN